MNVLCAMALPALIAAGTIGLGRALAAAKWSTRGDSFWAGPAIGLACIAGQALFAVPSFPPLDVTDRIPWLALTAMLLALAEANWPFGPKLRFLGRAVLLGLILVLMLGPVISAGDLSWTKIAWMLAAAVTAILAWLNLCAIAEASQGRDAYRSLMLTSLGAVLVLLHSGSATLCLLGIVLTVSLAAARIAAWHRTLDSGLIVGGAFLTALVIDGYVYASMPSSSAALLAAAPAGAWITRWGPLRRKAGVSAAALSSLAVLVPLGLAVGWAAASSPYE